MREVVSVEGLQCLIRLCRKVGEVVLIGWYRLVECGPEELVRAELSGSMLGLTSSQAES